jgi:topoisomerase-4 subunit A
MVALLVLSTRPKAHSASTAPTSSASRVPMRPLVTGRSAVRQTVRALKGHEVDAAALQFKAGDGLLVTFACRSVETLLVFGTAAKGSGRVYSVAVSSLPGGRGDGVPVTSLIDLEPGTQPAHYFAGAADATLLLASSAGFGLMAKAGDMHGRNKGGKAFLTVDEGATLLPPRLVLPSHHQVGCLAADGRLLVFALDELKLQPGGGKGLTLMDVDAKTPLLSVAPLADSLTVIGTTRGDKPKDDVLKNSALAAHVGKRARKGKVVDSFKKVLRLA